MYTQELSA